MEKSHTNKRKILNDPIYGFITIPNETIFDLIEHPYFQRLRRISQLGLTYLVYPGAYHTRFHHALGAMHLMQKAIDVLQSKGHTISPEEKEAVCIAILLHDVGHGPYSHALEHSIVNNLSHETVSYLMMDRLNAEFDGKLTLAIDIFRNRYAKKFLHQLISSQLDMDRLDYLQRDSFYTGVSEGKINSDRLITMLNIADDELVIDAKGIYSVEKFIVARRLMYWQVYLHKTVLAAEFMLVNILKRAKELANNGEVLFCTSALKTFLYDKIDKTDFEKKPELLDIFARLDDYDILSAVKEWKHHDDRLLAMLCNQLTERRLLKIQIATEPFTEEQITEKREKAKQLFGFTDEEVKYLVFTDRITNNAYNPKKETINLLYKDGSIADVAEAADTFNIDAMARTVKKYFFCFPKECR